jgi:hypothetical protein
MTASFSGRPREEIAECGRRLKEIQTRLRAIGSERQALTAERDRIQQG